jgi:hypothetical protein
MFELFNQSYYQVVDFLEKNIKKRTNIKPCVPIKFDSKSNDLYELFIVSIDNEYFDDPTKCFHLNDILFENAYYYILEYSDESFENELSVIDCGGYFIAVYVFKNKINVTTNYIYKKHVDGNITFQKFHMNTIIGTKFDKITKKIHES